MKRVLSLSFVTLFIAALCFMLPIPSAANDSSKNPRIVTFNKEVAPILYKHCVECHRPGEIGPMSLMTFKEARPWARSIKEKVATREMPPWHADPHSGRFSNERRLSQHEIDTIVAWADTGAKEGNPKDLPAAPRFTEGWHLGKPDMVLSMQEEHTLEASGPDEYINFVMPEEFKEDRWVRAAEIRPGNRRIVHHVIAFIQTPQVQEAWRASGGRPNPRSIFYQDGTLIRAKMDAPVYDDGCSAPNGSFARGSGQEGLGFPLCFYTPGKDIDAWPEGTAKHIPAGSKIVIQVHYSKIAGKVERDRSSVGLYFAPKPPEKILSSFGVINHYFKIPAGADNHKVTACYTFSRDVELYTFLPHMHVRGKDMKYEVVYPDGRRETLLDVPRYDFNWQTLYKLDRPLLMPKGARMIVTAHFDNSAKNKYNPNPALDVRFGDPTYDEMMIGYYDFAPAARKIIKLDPKVYDNYAGEYSVGPGATFTVSRDGDRLMFSAPGQPKIEAFPESEMKFFFTVVDAQATFIRGEDGQVSELLFEINGRQLRARKIKKAATGQD
jgi:hypothetical protein